MPIGFSPTGTFFVLFFFVLFCSSQFFSKPYGIQLVTPKVVAIAVKIDIAI